MKRVCNVKAGAYANILSEDNPSFTGILAGECKGDIWVDDVKNPELALVYSNAVGGFAILGEPKNNAVYDKFSEFLREVFFVELKSRGVDVFEFSVERERTEEYILGLFTDKSINQEDEFYYRKSGAYKLETPDKYNIIRVDPNFIEQLQAGKYDNAEFLIDRLFGSWESFEQFFTKSLAFVATLDKSIVSVIIGSARYKNVVPIDIETIQEHRKKGLAYILTQYFVNECEANELVAQWNCIDSNAASRKTAVKAGFNLIKKKPFYWFDI